MEMSFFCVSFIRKYKKLVFRDLLYRKFQSIELTFHRQLSRRDGGYKYISIPTGVEFCPLLAKVPVK